MNGTVPAAPCSPVLPVPAQRLQAARAIFQSARVRLGAADPARERIALGPGGLDAALGGGLPRGALHEVYAGREADVAAAAGFALGIVRRAARGRPLLWVRQDFLEAEAGELYPPGLAELGLDPGQMLLVRAPDAAGVLKAGGEAARCAGLGAVLIAPWGAPRRIDLTASRRLALAAEASAVPVLMLRVAAEPAPSAAATRWQVRAHPSAAAPARAPGLPAFAVTLLRQRGGPAGQTWSVEWNRDRSCFQDRGEDAAAALPAATLLGAMAALPARRSA